MSAETESRRAPNNSPDGSVTCGAVVYTPRNLPLQGPTPAAGLPSFPVPHIRPRVRRPHSIHIVSFPPGYIPHDLRPPPSPSRSRRLRSKVTPRAEDTHTPHQHVRQAAVPSDSRIREREPAGPDNPVNPANRLLDKLLASFGSQATPQLRSLTSTDTPPQPGFTSSSASQPAATPHALLDLRRRLSRVDPTERNSEDHMSRSASPAMVEAVRPPLMADRVHSSVHRNSLMSVRSAKHVMSSSVSEVPKPVASGSGLSCSILLAEQNVFLTGFDHHGQNRQETHNSTALLRGKLQLNVSKNAKIKSVTLKLVGKARTEWPEGIPPLKVDMFEEDSLRTQVLTFFHAMHETWETEFGNQCTYKLKGSCPHPHSGSTSPTHSAISLHMPTRGRGASTGLSARELKRLSLQSVQSRSFGKGDSPMVSQVQTKGFKVFYPGIYQYSFELPIDHHQLETIKLQYGSVKWELETVIERAGAFKPNLHGSKEVCIVRVPDQMSLEMTEPISISRQWEDQLHYDIMISGKSFPIGAKIPIAFKLTPLAKVQVHKLKVFVTESIEYWTNDHKVTRKDQGRKILLLEKIAGKPMDKAYETSDVRVLSGGELTTGEREEARATALRRRTMEAERARVAPQPLPEPADNLLGDLDLGLETFWGATEIEMNVQIPTCEMMAKNKMLKLHPDCSWKNVNVYHWIKIVMRISRLDPEDPAGKRRRHFEISIDSPFTVLNCRATQANMALPQYSSPDIIMYHQTSSCGCPDAEVATRNASPASSTGTLPILEADFAGNPVSAGGLPMPPQAAHVHTVPGRTPTSPTADSPHTSSGSLSANPIQRLREQEQEQAVSPRPIHLLRVPSFDPPAFNAEEPPPPLETPPPNYDVVVGTPSVDGLADYFSRLADYEDSPTASGDEGFYFGDHRQFLQDDEEDSDSADDAPARILSPGGRVNVANPRTPGGRMVPSRSLEIERPVLHLDIVGALRRRAGDS